MLTFSLMIKYKYYQATVTKDDWYNIYSLYKTDYLSSKVFLLSKYFSEQKKL